MKRYILTSLFIFTALFRLSAQLSDPVMEFERTWAYQYELLEIPVHIVGTSDVSRVKTELIVIEGDIDIREEKRSHGSSYNYITEEQTVFVGHKFKLVPLKSQRIILKATVKDLHNNLILESNTITIDLIPQPSHPESQPPNRDAVNLNLHKSEIYQGEETLLLLEVFTDEIATNVEEIEFKELPIAIKYMREGKIKKIFFQGEYGSLYTLPLLIYTKLPGKYTIPAQDLEIKIRNRDTKKISTKTLRTNSVELTVKELPNFSEETIIASKMELILEDYPPKIVNDEEFIFTATVISDGCLDNIESLKDYFKGRVELKEESINRVKIYKNGEALYKVITKYSMTSKSLVGVKFPKIRIPYISTEDGNPTEFEYKFPAIEGKVNPILFWSFIFVILAIVAISTLGVLIYIKKNKGKKKKKNLDQDIPIDENNIAQFHTFVEEFNLTQREKDILKILVEGKSTRDIADSLYISPETAKKHINNIMKKTQTHSRYEIYVLLNKHVKQDN